MIHGRISGSTVVITGASNGIGRATALALAVRGARLVLCSRGDRALDATVRECRLYGADVIGVPTDVGDEPQVLKLRDEALRHFDTIDVWISNAAVTAFGRVEETPARDVERLLRTNLMGAVNSARAVIPHFRERGTGTLIIVSSVAGLKAQPFTSAYCASKSAQLRLAESLRQEVDDAPGIRICALLPASIDTPIFGFGANYTGRRARPMPPVYAASMVANDLIALIRRPVPQRISGFAGHLLQIAAWLAPRQAEKFMASNVREDHFTDQPAPRSPGNLHAPSCSQGAVSGGWGGRHPGAKWPLLAVGALAGVATALAVESSRAPRRRTWRWA